MRVVSLNLDLTDAVALRDIVAQYMAQRPSANRGQDTDDLACSLAATLRELNILIERRSPPARIVRSEVSRPILGTVR